MQNEITKSIPDMLSMAATVKGAATEHGPTIPLLQNTAVNIGADADALTTTRNNHEQGKVVLASRRSVLLSVILTVRVFLTLGRDLLKPQFGKFYSSAYDILGLVGSLEIPDTAEELLPIVQAYQAFYIANPLKENADANITAARALELYNELLVASTNVNLQKGQMQILRVERDEAAEALRKRLRDVVDELGMRLDPLDGRWLAFGFNMPGAQETPDQVQHVQVTLLGPTAAAVKWPTTARAEYFRVWKKVIGVDEEPITVGSPADLDFTIEELPVNSTIEIYVSAINSGGESPLSEKITIVTHA